jgi:SAM-dependent methyltransferase
MSRDQKTVESFGFQWSRFDQTGADPRDLELAFESYFRIFPWDVLPERSIGFDLGCGSGRWATFAAPRVGTLVCVEPSGPALAVAKRNAPDCPFVQGAAGELAIRDCSLDFGYCLGVLHYTPDPLAGLADAVRALKPGAPFLLYLYYALDDRPAWFRILWRISDAARRQISRWPAQIRYAVSQVIAAMVYLPLARLAAVVERIGRDVDGFPLSAYRHRGFYLMRNDALDRFGSPIERRFTRLEVTELLRAGGLERIMVHGPPYWCAVGYKRE